MWMRSKWAATIVLVVGALLAVVCSLYSSRYLRIESDQDKLIDPSNPEHARYLRFVRAAGDLEYIYAVVEAPSREKFLAWAARFEAETKTRSDLFSAVEYRIDLSHLKEKGLFFADLPELARLSAALEEVRRAAAAERAVRPSTTTARPPTPESPPAPVSPAVDGLTREEGKKLYFRGLKPDEIRELDEKIRSGELTKDEVMSGTTSIDERNPRESNAPTSTMLSKSESAPVDTPTRKHSARTPELEAWLRDTIADLIRVGYGLSASGKTIVSQPSERLFEEGPYRIVKIMPTKRFDQLNIVQAPLEALRDIRKRLEPEFPGVTVGFTGRPVLQADEMETTNSDSLLGTVAALLLVVLLYIAVFRDLSHPLMVMLSFSMAMAITFGIATLLIGHLNILSITFAMILVGLGMDYGIHVANRYREEREAGAGVSGALASSVRSTGGANLVGMATSVAAFLSPIGSGFTGLVELGVLSSIGLLLSLLSMVLFFPSMVLLFDSRRERVSPVRGRATVNLLYEPIGKFPGFMIGVIALGAIAGGAFSWKLRLDYNILDLQSPHLESVQTERRLSAASGTGAWYSGLVVDSFDEAHRVATEARKKLTTVSKVQSISDFLPELPAEKVSRLHGIRRALNALETESIVRLVRDAATDESIRASRPAEVPKAWVNQNLPRIRAALEGAVGEWVRMTRRGLKELTVNRDDLPAGIRSYYESVDGKPILYFFPKENIWDADKLETHVRELSQFSDAITGPTFSVYHGAQLMEQTFATSAGLSFGAVMLIILVAFRSLLALSIVAATLIASLGWLLLAMESIGLQFNLANFFSIPLIFGLSIDSAIHVVHRFKELKSARATLQSAGMGVMVSILTTAIAFGCLSFASHRGLASLGWVMTLGMGANLLIVVFGLFPLLVWIERSANRNGAEASTEIPVPLEVTRRSR